MLVVDPGLIKDVKLLNIVCLAKIFLRNSNLDEWHQRHVNSTLKKLLLQHFSTCGKFFAQAFSLANQSFGHPGTKTRQELEQTVHVLVLYY